MFNSIEPKRSFETNVSTKGHLPGDKRLWPLFSHIIDCEKSGETIYGVPKSIFTLSVEVITSFL